MDLFCVVGGSVHRRVHVYPHSSTSHVHTRGALVGTGTVGFCGLRILLLGLLLGGRLLLTPSAWKSWAVMLV